MQVGSDTTQVVSNNCATGNGPGLDSTFGGCSTDDKTTGWISSDVVGPARRWIRCTRAHVEAPAPAPFALQSSTRSELVPAAAGAVEQCDDSGHTLHLISILLEVIIGTSCLKHRCPNHSTGSSLHKRSVESEGVCHPKHKQLNFTVLLVSFCPLVLCTCPSFWIDNSFVCEDEWQVLGSGRSLSPSRRMVRDPM